MAKTQPKASGLRLGWAALLLAGLAGLGLGDAAQAAGQGAGAGAPGLATGAAPGNRPASPTVVLGGIMGNKALLIINASAPKAVAVGDTYLGVTVVSILGDSAVVAQAGQTRSVRVGEAPVSVGALAASGTNGTPSGKIVMQAGSGGHFAGQGQINGKSFQFLVDTGATAVSLGLEDAKRMGLNYLQGQQIPLATANGMSRGWRVKLAVVRVGDVDVYDVDAVVTPSDMPYVLLGNSFLTRFQMTRTNETLVLVKRY